MSELAQIMEYVNNFTGNASAFKRGVVIDENMGDKISVTVVATGFNVSNLPQIGLEEDDDNKRIVLGNSGIYGSDDIPASTNRIVIDSIPEEDNQYQRPQTREIRTAVREEFATASREEVPQEVAPDGGYINAPQPYVRRSGKPALILEAGDDISKLENQPAYLRRNQKLQEELIQPQQESGEMKIEQINGGHHLSSDNSYLHQTQD